MRLPRKSAKDRVLGHIHPHREGAGRGVKTTGEGAFCGGKGKFQKGVGDRGKCPECSSRIGSHSVHSAYNCQVIGTLLRAMSVGWAATYNDLENKFKVEMQ